MHTNIDTNVQSAVGCCLYICIHIYNTKSMCGQIWVAGEFLGTSNLRWDAADIRCLAVKTTGQDTGIPIVRVGQVMVDCFLCYDLS
jgi:hypothetical protein